VRLGGLGPRARGAGAALRIRPATAAAAASQPRSTIPAVLLLLRSRSRTRLPAPTERAAWSHRLAPRPPLHRTARTARTVCTTPRCGAVRFCEPLLAPPTIARECSSIMDHGVLLLTTFSLAAAAGPKLPAFSWAKLPVFLHTENASGPWSSAALQRIAQFPLVTLEKSYNAPAQKAGHRLDKTTGAACAAIHAINPATKVLYYTNSEMIYGCDPLSDRAKSDDGLVLKDEHGDDVVYANHLACYNVASSAARRLFSESCVNTTLPENGGCDGCYLDRATTQSWPTGNAYNTANSSAFMQGHEAQIYNTNADLLTSTQTFALFNNPGPMDNPGEMRPDGAAAMLEEFTASEQYILRLQAAAKSGFLIEAHAGNRQGGSDNYCESITNSLAAFLVGMGEQAYYHCSSGKTASGAAGKWSTDPRWPNAPDEWLDERPEYNRPLGKPLSDGEKGADGVWRRYFSSGTNVSFTSLANGTAGNGTIAWADGHTQHGFPTNKTDSVLS
jgi:hypothetical protein